VDRDGEGLKERCVEIGDLLRDLRHIFRPHDHVLGVGPGLHRQEPPFLGAEPGREVGKVPARHDPAAPPRHPVADPEVLHILSYGRHFAHVLVAHDRPGGQHPVGIAVKVGPADRAVPDLHDDFVGRRNRVRHFFHGEKCRLLEYRRLHREDLRCKVTMSAAVMAHSPLRSFTPALPAGILFAGESTIGTSQRHLLERNARDRFEVGVVRDNREMPGPGKLADQEVGHGEGKAAGSQFPR
jgi:hypothetical protein